MTVIETYQCFLALSRHFKSDYDYFKYGGKVRASEESFYKRKDRVYFARVAKENNPEEYMAANFIFQEKPPHISGMQREHWLTIHKYKKNGLYLFEQDLLKLKRPFNDNFSVDSGSTVPYIVQLYMSGDVSMHTLCVFEKILKMNEKWKKDPIYIVYGDAMKKVCKSAPFFDIDTKTYKNSVLDHFSV